MVVGIFPQSLEGGRNKTIEQVTFNTGKEEKSRYNMYTAPECHLVNVRYHSTSKLQEWIRREC